MKNLIKKASNIALRFAKGAGDQALMGLPTTIIENIKSKDGGEGKIDIVKIIGTIAVIGTFIYLLKIGNSTDEALEGAKGLSKVLK